MSNFKYLETNEGITLIKAKKGGKSKKAPTESDIPNSVFAYANTNNVLKSINFMNSEGKIDKQIGGGVIHFKNDRQKKEYWKRQKAIKTNNPKKGKMGKSKKNELEMNLHVHYGLNKYGIDRKKSKVRHKLSVKERRYVYESIDMAKKEGVAIWN